MCAWVSREGQGGEAATGVGCHGLAGPLLSLCGVSILADLLAKDIHKDDPDLGVVSWENHPHAGAEPN